MPAKNCLFGVALSFSALLLGFPTVYWAQVIPSEAPAAPHGFTESAFQEPDRFNLSPNARHAGDIIGVEPLFKRLSSLAAVPGMSLEELALRQQITEAVVVASLDLDSVVDDIDNEHAQIVELQNIVLARRQRAIGTTHLARLAYGPDTQSETGFRKAPRPIADKAALICSNYKGDSRGVTNWSLLAGMERWRTCA